MPISVNISYDIGVVGCVVVVPSGQVCSVVVVSIVVAIVGGIVGVVSGIIWSYPIMRS